MKKIVLLAHDPGGYDVVKPVYEELLKTGCEVVFYCVGPASKLDEEFATTKDAVVHQVDCLLKTQQLAALVTGTSWGDDFELQLLAKTNLSNILTISILDYWSNYKSRFAYAGGYVYPKYYIMMDELAKKEAIAEGVPSKIIRVLGHPGFKKYLEKNSSNTCTEGKVLLLSQPLYRLYGNSLGYNEMEFLNQCMEVLDYLGLRYNIKFHPKDLEAVKRDYVLFGVDGGLDELIDEYSLVIGMNSMALLYSYLMGKRIISYQPGLVAEDLCITNKLKITRLVTTKEKLLEEIKYGENEKINRSVYFNSSGKLIVQFILSEIKK